MKNELVLYLPLLKTFPAIDAVLVLPREETENHEGRIVYVQATVAEPVPIQYQRLKDLYRGLASRNEFAGYTHMLLFMVSDDIYDRFTFQPYKDGDTITHEKENDFMVTQYVGKIIQ
ncbi:hypothetical protein PR001_g15321 [Phytophthora rubi]|uniref:Uncharacterized protein n=1 Tax=Phytophthora rubi TaxID=129364 RepID=A0A6A3L4E0_9STRA|nr:hypothetical protein PR001_g15321 [Phytophthora rubi]